MTSRDTQRVLRPFEEEVKLPHPPSPYFFLVHPHPHPHLGTRAWQLQKTSRHTCVFSPPPPFKEEGTVEGTEAREKSFQIGLHPVICWCKKKKRFFGCVRQLCLLAFPSRGSAGILLWRLLLLPTQGSPLGCMFSHKMLNGFLSLSVQPVNWPWQRY